LAEEGSVLPGYVQREFEDYLKCGRLGRRRESLSFFGGIMKIGWGVYIFYAWPPQLLYRLKRETATSIGRISMATLVGVHGIAQELRGARELEQEWEPALLDGLDRADASSLKPELSCAFYGHLFRPAGGTRAAGDHYRASDLEADEQELLMQIWAEAARVEPERVFPPDGLRTATSVQTALRVLAQSSFFAGLAERALIGSLKQVRRYLREPDIRSGAQEVVHTSVTPQTRAIVAHSLGSVVAFEALHRYADCDNWANVTAFITLGSPLGIPNLIFDSLEPKPKDGLGAWPSRLVQWTNLSDDGDVVALKKELAPLFGPKVSDTRVCNQSRAHDIRPYLNAAETGRAIADALA
jgi:hypothetical protein